MPAPISRGAPGALPPGPGVGAPGWQPEWIQQEQAGGKEWDPTWGWVTPEELARLREHQVMSPRRLSRGAGSMGARSRGGFGGGGVDMDSLLELLEMSGEAPGGGYGGTGSYGGGGPGMGSGGGMQGGWGYGRGY